jgi:hypothetical protein
MNAPTSLASMQSTAVAPREAHMPAVAPGFGSLQSFELMVRQAKLLTATTLVPAAYRQFTEKKRGQNVDIIENPNALANCCVALNMAVRMGRDPLMVMQNLYIVEGRPSWSSQWIIAAINECGRFSPLRFALTDLGEKDVEYVVTEWENNQRVNRKVKVKVCNMQCIAWAIEKESGERLESPKVDIEMAVKEGWYGKNGSKWQTMPEVMLRYRTAAFFGKLYAPELLMGLQSVEEAHDIIDITPAPAPEPKAAVDLEQVRAGQHAAAAPAAEEALKPATVDDPAVAHQAEAEQPAETGNLTNLASSGDQGGEAEQTAAGQPEQPELTDEQKDYQRSLLAEQQQAQAQAKPTRRAAAQRPPIDAD